MAHQRKERNPEHGAAQHEGNLRTANDLRRALVEGCDFFDERRILLVIVFDLFLPHSSEGKVHHRIVVIDKGNDQDDEKPKADPFYMRRNKSSTPF